MKKTIQAIRNGLLCVLVCTVAQRVVAQTAITVSLSKTAAYSTEPFTVTWNTGSVAPVYGDYIAFYNTASNFPTLITGRVAVASTDARASSRTWSLSLTTAGTFEARYVRFHSYTPQNIPVWETLARSGTVTITLLNNAAFTVWVSRTDPLLREDTTVFWYRGTNTVSFLDDHIALYPANTPMVITGRVALASVRAYTFVNAIASERFFITRSGELVFRYIRYRGNDTNGEPIWDTLGQSSTVTVREPVSDPLLIRNYPSPGEKIILFSDSLGLPYATLDPEESVAHQLGLRLCMPILNQSIAGNTTAQALARLQTDVISQNPKVVIIMLGGNDFIQRIKPDVTFANLLSIIDQIHAAGSVVILVGVQGGPYFDNFADRYRQLADMTGCAYEPNILLGVIGNSRFMSSDFVHPNDWGNAIIGKRLSGSVRKLISEPRPIEPVRVTFDSDDNASARLTKLTPRLSAKKISREEITLTPVDAAAPKGGWSTEELQQFLSGTGTVEQVH